MIRNQWSYNYTTITGCSLALYFFGISCYFYLEREIVFHQSAKDMKYEALWDKNYYLKEEEKSCYLH